MTILSKGLSERLQQNSPYQKKYEQSVQDAGTYSFGELKTKYPGEFNSWRGRKSWAKAGNVEWSPCLISFQDFLVVMGPIPEQGWTLDRINPLGAYEPTNLRWADKLTQTTNRSITRRINVGGKIMTIAEIAARIGSNYNAVRVSLRRNGDNHALALIADFDAKHPHADLWDFPQEYRAALNSLYVGSNHAQRSRAEFFENLLDQEIFRLEFQESVSSRESRRSAMIENLDVLRRLKIEVSIHLRTRKRELERRALEAKHSLIYKNVDLQRDNFNN